MNKLTKHVFSDLYTMSSGISSTKEQAGHGAPFLSFSAVFNNYFVPDELLDFMDASETQQETYSIKKGDIFLTRTSEVIDELAMSSVATKNYPRATYSGFLKRLRPTQNDVSYPKFMAFYLRGSLFRKTMTNNAVMTLRASLNEDIFSYLDLLLPEFDEQVKIGDLLYAINQKIDINDRANRQLESMAKTLYDYWFIQFDFPNKDERPYKSDGGNMVYNENLRREIPLGWNCIKLNSILDNKVKSVQAKNVPSCMPYTPIDFIPMKKMSFASSLSSKEAKTSLISYSENDILIGAMRVYFHRVSIAPYDGITRSTSMVLCPKNTSHLPFLYQVCNEERTILVASKLSVGTQQPYINWDDRLENHLVPYPNDEGLIEKYSKIVRPMQEKVICNEKENESLRRLRDFLLPMLINGQVTVK